MNKCRIALIVGAIVGVVLIIVVAVLGFKVLPDIVHDQIEENVILDKSGTEQFDRFEELPFALNYSIYFFNVTNPYEVMEGKKPNVTQVGPIVYKKFQHKRNIKFNDAAKTIEYEQIKIHEYAPEYSSINKTENVTIINTPLVSVMQIFENVGLPYLSDILGKGYKDAFNMKSDKTVFHSINVTDYMFDGYKFCNPEEHVKDNDAAKFVCAAVRLLAPESMEIEKSRQISFSFFKQKNDTSDGVYEVEQGVNDIKNVGNTIKWRGSKKTPFWLDDKTKDYHCNDIKGTDSTIYGPHNDEDSRFFIFNTDICRTVELEFTEEVEYADIPGYRSTLRKENINWTLPENECYCIRRTRNLKGKLECLPDGFTDLYSCFSAPVVLSLPHFLWADPEYQATVDGLNPIEDDHKIYIDMEPNTGSPMRGHKRVQFNVILRNYAVGTQIQSVLKKIIPSVVPILWLDEHVDIPEDLQNLIKDQYLTPVTAIEISKWCLIGVGIAIFVVCSGIFIYKRRSS